MLLQIVNLVLDAKFRQASKDKDFRKFAAGYDCSVVMKTLDNRSGKRFIFKNGTYASDNVLDEFDSALVWKDNLTALKALLAGNDQAIYEEVQKHNAFFLGPVHIFNWFGSAMNLVMGRTRPR